MSTEIHGRLQELAAQDEQWAKVVAWFLKQDRLAERVGWVIRSAIDAVLDGVHTGRYDYDGHLDRVEKSYLGYKVEHLLLHEFGLPGGTGELDTTIEGIPVDVKWTGGHHKRGWTIPPEAFDQICVVLWGHDEKGVFSFGVIRAREEWLNKGKNRDAKRTLSEDGRNNIFWLVDEHSLPENVLYHLDPEVRAEILSYPGGTQRVAAFFRAVQGKPVPRSVIATLGQQIDSAKRARDARKILEEEGIELLQGRWEEDRLKAQQLGITLGPDDWVSIPMSDD